MAPNCISKIPLLYVALLLLATTLAGQEERVLFTNGEQSLRTGDYASARATFEAILKRNPKNVAALANLGVVFAQTRNYELAAATYRKALVLNPTHPLLHLNLGLALFYNATTLALCFAAAMTPVLCAVLMPISSAALVLHTSLRMQRARRHA